MRRPRIKYDGILSYQHPTIDQLESFLDGFDLHHKVDADSIGGDDPHINRRIRALSGYCDDIDIAKEIILMKYL